MCALDALGIPLMLGRSALITSVDALTGEPVRVLARPARSETPWTPGDVAPREWVTVWEPKGAVVFARLEGDEHDEEGVAAAGVSCPVTNFFATAEHARTWATAHSETDGVVLTQVEALARASARFGDVLDRLEPADRRQTAG
jgi:alkylmercury lyase